MIRVRVCVCICAYRRRKWTPCCEGDQTLNEFAFSSHFPPTVSLSRCSDKRAARELNNPHTRNSIRGLCLLAADVVALQGRKGTANNSDSDPRTSNIRHATNMSLFGTTSTLNADADAPLADAAVVRTGRPVRLAPRAHRPLFPLVAVVLLRVEVRKVDPDLGQRHGARIEQDRFQVGHRQQEHDRVERHHMERCPKAEERKGTGMIRLRAPKQRCIIFDNAYHRGTPSAPYLLGIVCRIIQCVTT